MTGYSDPRPNVLLVAFHACVSADVPATVKPDHYTREILDSDSLPSAVALHMAKSADVSSSRSYRDEAATTGGFTWIVAPLQSSQ